MSSKFYQKILLTGLVIIVPCAFLMGFWRGEMRCEVCSPEDIDFTLFWKSYYKLQEKFVDQEKFDSQKILYGAISGMTKSLDDPYTTFFNPEETKLFMDDVIGEFEGVGMEIGMRDGQLTVIAPLKGTPAEKAGLRAGDKIIKIDDTFSQGIDINEAIKLIRGARGTEVLFSILRENQEELKEFKITRAVIEVPSLEWEIIENNIAHLKIYQFSDNTNSDFREVASEILKSPAQKIILDLRSNPGGYLQVANSVAGWFLEKGKVVVIESPKDKIEDFDEDMIEYKSQGPERLLAYPIVILINQGTASGAEILAGALRDNRGIQLIGETSFGKGCVQEIANMDSGSMLKITIANWFTPNGKLISDKGLEPDVKIEMTDEDYTQGKDPQLEKAIEIIKNI